MASETRDKLNDEEILKYDIDIVDYYSKILRMPVGTIILGNYKVGLNDHVADMAFDYCVLNNIINIISKKIDTLNEKIEKKLHLLNKKGIKFSGVGQKLFVIENVEETQVINMKKLKTYVSEKVKRDEIVKTVPKKRLYFYCTRNDTILVKNIQIKNGKKINKE